MHGRSRRPRHRGEPIWRSYKNPLQGLADIEDMFEGLSCLRLGGGVTMIASG
jgi:hypothetical protein